MIVRTMITTEVIRGKKGIIMRTFENRWVELSQEGNCNGIKPGDKFILNCVKEMVIGFSNDLYKADSPFTLIWTLPKREKGVEGWEKDGRIKKLKQMGAIRKTEKAMTPDTTEEEIKNFLNS